jgi:hypothetical protein
MIDATQFLNKIRERDPDSFLVFQNLIDGINGVAKQLGVDPTGKVSPPDPPEALNIKANNGIVHAVITHNAPINKTIQYLVECDTDPNFSNPHVEDLGASRGKFFSLPNKTDGGDAQPWHFKAYAQYSGSDASKKVYFGSQVAPTAVTVGGTAQLTPIPSTGSGTAAANGQQSGLGLGTVLTRKGAGL